MDSNDLLPLTKSGFDNDVYYRLQKNAIIQRINKFSKGRLYLEIGGKFLFDPHAARVLPGFDPNIKQKILADLKEYTQILFCVDWDGIVSDRQLKNTKDSYRSIVEQTLSQIENSLGNKPILVLNRCRTEINYAVEDFINRFKDKGYQIYKRYFIEGYPKRINKILSDEGFGADDYIELSKSLILVVSPASNSGKLSTCLGQIYLDHQNGIESGYAKFELFPIWNLPISHPINLAYEAATADIGDFNIDDTLHEKAYNQKAVNYNRDVEAFTLLRALADKIVDESNFIKEYKSPTDMGINMSGYAITNDAIVSKAALDEINRRIIWYQEIVARGDGKFNWVYKCKLLAREAEKYLKNTTNQEA